jgi:hypothetical protein
MKLVRRHAAEHATKFMIDGERRPGTHRGAGDSGKVCVDLYSR